MNKAVEYNNPIILFDGVCNMCSGIVLFVIKRDPEGIFRYAPLQSQAGKSLLERFNLPIDELHSLILVEGDRCYKKSTAALRVAKRMKGLWPVLYPLVLVPRPIRDFIYDLIARNRYRWFGRRDECLAPTPDVRSRFLE